MAIVSVFGATGRQGLAQIKCLLKSGYKVRALSRNSTPNLGGLESEVDARVVDLLNPDTIAPAIKGSDYVFHNHPLNLNVDRVAMMELIGQACVDENISRLVWNTSSWIPDRPGDSFSYERNTIGINKLWALGVPATVFGGVLFMDNLLTDWVRPSMMKDHRYMYPHSPDLGISWICLDDVAKIMVASLDRPDMVGAWMNIGGPEKLTGPMVAKILSGVLGFELDYDPYTPEEFADALAEAMGDALDPAARKDFTKFISDFYHYNNTAPTTPFSVNTEYMLERLPEIQLETMQEWASRQDWSDSADRPSGG